ncbi:alpha,alpha-phosphotrehalase [Weissella soli]|uniref:alpha,alpha-phosphotrehalase n=1 Tax=Weissella soli TaxID=155866 RepID=UPI00359FC51E
MSFSDKVIYQIYPKSFLDTTGNGIGDLRGIIQKLDYLKELGIDMLWLNPFYPSPQRDNGYDISDYTAINPDFGTMADFEELVYQAKQHGIELMLDMVLNHVSIEHEWFQKALAGDADYQDFFILRDEPTDWVSKFGGSAWAPFGDTGKYYLHLYDVTQADLNWRNPKVRQALYDVVNFWQDKGVNGFRFDVINVIGKDAKLRNHAANDGKPEYTDKPITHDYLRELNEKTFGKNPSAITVGEMSSTTIENCVLYTRSDRHELTMTFNFHHLKVDYENGQKWTLQRFDFAKLRQLFHDWGEQMSQAGGWNALFWNNHDQPRALNRFIDVQHFRVKGATMLATSIHLSRGTPYIYMGEEIGMLDPNFDTITDYVDVESKNAYQMLLKHDKSASEALTIIKAKSRDNSRIPMAWDNSANGGFTTGTPWLKAGYYESINVAKDKDGEIFKFYQMLIRLRKEMPIVAEGNYHAVYRDDANIYAFERVWHGQRMLVLNNFTNHIANYEPLATYKDATLLVNNDVSFTDGQLQPYQSVALIIGGI